MPHPQFTLRALLVAMLAVACFFGGIRFEREQQRKKLEEMDFEIERGKLVQKMTDSQLQNMERSLQHARFDARLARLQMELEASKKPHGNKSRIQESIVDEVKKIVETYRTRRESGDK